MGSNNVGSKAVNHRAYGAVLVAAFLCMVFAGMAAQENHEPQSPIFQLIFWVIVGRWIWVTVQARRANASEPSAFVMTAEIEKKRSQDRLWPRRRTGIYADSFIAPPKPAAPSARLDELERVHRLMQSGALTGEEFEIEKRRILG